MKVIFKIAKAELCQFFYSPIAWLVLIVFTVQSGIVFVNMMQGEIWEVESGRGAMELTGTIFTNWRGVFTQVQQYLYLYIPLLTMGLLSKEKATGSIKLLFSSPINNTQIVLGKLGAMLIYGLILIGILGIYVLYGYFTIDHFDLPHVLSALLGIYLLTCAYASIGLFMSTLTSYQVVAVVSTLALLTILNMVGDMWNDIPVLRDVAYWLSLKGRSNDMLKGLICSEDVIYFLLIITMFVLLSICKLYNERKRVRRLTASCRYLVIVLVAFGVGQVSTMPKLMTYYDATCVKSQTLTPNSQKIMEKLDGPLTITAYVNLLDPFYSRYMPNNRNVDKKKFRQFTRFKPEIEFKYVYYWDKAQNPRLYEKYPGKTDREIVESLAERLELDLGMFMTPEEFDKPEELTIENNRFTRILERGNGDKAVLRIFTESGFEPEEEHIAAALKRMVDGPCRLAFITGHGEPSIYRIGERGFSNFTLAAYSQKALVNNGFEVFELNLKEQRMDSIKVDLLVATQMKEPFTKEEMVQIKEYLAKGGNMLIAGEPGSQDFMNPLLEDFGVQFMPGRIMQNNPNFVSNLALPHPTKAAEQISSQFRWMNRWNYKTPMLNAVAIDCSNAASRGVETVVVMETDSVGFWNEQTDINFKDTEAELNPEVGEKEDAYTMAVRVSRKVGDKEQRIFVCGDTDWLTNGERATRRSRLNSDFDILQTTALQWLTNDNYPVNVRRPYSPDVKFFVGADSIVWMKLFFWFVLPILLTASCIIIQVKRKRK